MIEVSDFIRLAHNALDLLGYSTTNLDIDLGEDEEGEDSGESGE